VEGTSPLELPDSTRTPLPEEKTEFPAKVLLDLEEWSLALETTWFIVLCESQQKPWEM
jgi:hypothetical protein